MGFLCCAACQPGDSSTQNTEFMSSLEYDLSAPLVSAQLARELKEISGMVPYSQGQLLAVQDELGLLFIFDAETGDTIERITFAEDGDYEGICLVGNIIYVLRSDGIIFKIDKTKKEEVAQIATGLNADNNTEGICYDPKTESLLIACKEKSEIGDGDADTIRAIYRFDLKTQILDKKPAYTICISDLRAFVENSKEEGIEEFKELMTDNPHVLYIYPSDIAIHPISGDLYISSARIFNSLLVLSPDGKIKSCVPIPKSLLEQPEGICFLANGDMYLSSEGKPSEERLFLFEWKNKKK
jgi:hypothetical protein